MNDIEFQGKIRNYIFKPFFVGDKSKGWDCLNSLKDFFESMGIQFPTEYKGWTESNYAERWNRGEGNGNDTLRDFALTLGRPIDPNYIRVGDIIVLSKDGLTSLGQYVGSGNFKTHHETMGGIVLPLRFFKRAIVGVRRLTE